MHYFDSKTNVLNCRNLNICGCLGYFLPRERTLCFPSLNFTRFLLARFFSLSQSLSVAVGPCDAHSTAAQSGKLCTISAENSATLT